MIALGYWMYVDMNAFDVYLINIVTIVVLKCNVIRIDVVLRSRVIC